MVFIFSSEKSDLSILDQTRPYDAHRTSQYALAALSLGIERDVATGDQRHAGVSGFCITTKAWNCTHSGELLKVDNV